MQRHDQQQIMPAKTLLLSRGLPAAAILVAALVGLGFIPIDVIASLVFLALFVGLVFLLLRFIAKALPRFIARLRLSIRWKILLAIVPMAVLFLLMSLFNVNEMEFMHQEVHNLQVLVEEAPSWQVRSALEGLEGIQHDVIDASPFLATIAALLALGLGVVLAWSVIGPVREMGNAMRRIASGDFSQPVLIENKDELGELAVRINNTARELAGLQETTLAAERARALQDRIVQVTQTQEEERRRISRELHDDLGPSLAALGNRVRVSQSLVRTNPDKVEAELEGIAKSLKGHIQQIRNLIYDLRPPTLDQLGLKGAIRQHVDRFRQETEVHLSVTISDEITLDPLAEVTIFRIIQECLSNIQRHANATQVELRLASLETAIELVVRDNGRGFDPQAPVSNDSTPRVGLSSMRERAELLGANLLVQSSPGKGCAVLLNIPLRQVQNGAHSGSAGG